jgi:hypothetical protein
VTEIIARNTNTLLRLQATESQTHKQLQTDHAKLQRENKKLVEELELWKSKYAIVSDQFKKLTPQVRAYRDILKEVSIDVGAGYCNNCGKIMSDTKYVLLHCGAVSLLEEEHQDVDRLTICSHGVADASKKIFSTSAKCM